MNLDPHLTTLIELGFSENRLPQLQSYLQLLWKSNEELNLISRKMTEQELVENHVIDCLLPLRRVPQGLSRVADFGSGGGLPAVIYALQFPQSEWHLFEKSPKKRQFLEACKKIAPNLVLQSEIPPQFSGFDLVTARAFKPVDVLLQLSQKYFTQGGKYFLLKGRHEKIEEEIQQSLKKMKSLKREQFRIEPLHSPVLQVERNLVLINF